MAKRKIKTEVQTNNCEVYGNLRIINVTPDNYDDFKSSEKNRDLRKPHVKRLMANLEKNPLIEPIVCNSSKTIIAGHHRFKAMTEMGESFQIVCNSDSRIIETLLPITGSMVEKWKLKDYIKYHGYTEILDYEKIGISHTSSCRILGITVNSLKLGEIKGQPLILKDCINYKELYVFANSFYEILHKAIIEEYGRKDGSCNRHISIALFRIWNLERVNKDRLFDIVLNHFKDINKFKSLNDITKQAVKHYNRNLRDGRITVSDDGKINSQVQLVIKK